MTKRIDNETDQEYAERCGYRVEPVLGDSMRPIQYIVISPREGRNNSRKYWSERAAWELAAIRADQQD